MTSPNGTASRNHDINGGSAFIPLSAKSESLQEFRHEVTELARALPGELRRLCVRNGDREIEIEWSTDNAESAASVGDQLAAAHPAGSLAQVEPGFTSVSGDALTAVRAPLVGCYFAAPTPDAEPFVRVGDEVEAGTTVAIIEAMKMMNHIVAEESGIVAEVLVANGESVEYDQILLRLRPKEEAT
jgi:acetyl-CoA carboxylase biotin carboxyl carrier protein